MHARLPHAFLWGWLLLAGLCLLPLLVGVGSGGDSPQSTPDFARVLRLGTNSIRIAVVATGVAVVAGTASALAILATRRRPLRFALLVSGLTMLFVPPAVASVVAVRLLGANGVLTHLLFPGWQPVDMTLSASADPAALAPAPIYSLTGAGVVLGFCHAPVVLVAALAALARRERAILDAAALDAPPFSVLARITLPLAAPGIAAGAVAVFALALLDFSVSESLRSLPTLVADVYMQFGVFYDTRAALLSAGAVIALGLATAAALALVVRAGVHHEGAETERAHAPNRHHDLPLPARLFGIVACIGPILVTVVTLLVTMGEARGDALGVLRRTFDLTWDELVFGIPLGLGCAAVAGVAGLLLGRALAALKSPAWARVALLACFLVPGPVWGVGLASLGRLPRGSLPLGLDDALAALSATVVPLVLATALRTAPLIAFLVEFALRRQPVEWRESARLEGATALERARLYGVRSVAPALAGGMGAAFALALADPGAAILLLPPGPTIPSVRLLTLMHFAPQGEVSALCLFVLIPGVVLGGAGVAFGLRLAGTASH